MLPAAFGKLTQLTSLHFMRPLPSSSYGPILNLPSLQSLSLKLPDDTPIEEPDNFDNWRLASQYLSSLEICGGKVFMVRLIPHWHPPHGNKVAASLV